MLRSEKKSAADEREQNEALLGKHDGYINSQSDAPFSALTFCGHDIKGHGCEIVALHNALCYLKRGEPFPQVIQQCRLFGLAWLFGAFGISPGGVGRFLDKYGIKKQSYISAGRMYGAMAKKGSGAGIVSYWNKPIKYGIHTVFFTYENLDGTIKLCTYNHADEAGMKKRLIKAYLI